MRITTQIASKVINALWLTSLLSVLPASATEPHRVAFIDAHVIRGVLDTMGYEEGENIAFKRFQSSPLIGRHLPGVVAEALDWNPDVIVTRYAGATRAAMNGTTDIPIVAMIIVDPVKAGLVESFAKPGGNVTGVVLPNAALFGKKLELLKELLPDLKRVGVIFDPGTENGVTVWQDGQSIASHQGLGLEPVRLSFESDVVPALQTAVDAKCDAFIVLASQASQQHTREIGEFSVTHGLPILYPNSGYFEYRSGKGPVSFGPNWVEVDLEMADLIDQILKGADPGVLPIRQVKQSELVLVRGVANQMGLTITKSVLARASRVID